MSSSSVKVGFTDITISILDKSQSLHFFEAYCAIEHAKLSWGAEKPGLNCLISYVGKLEASWVISRMEVGREAKVDKMAVETRTFSLDTIKKELREGSLESLDSRKLAKFFQELQIKSCGTKKDLMERLLPLKDKDLFDRRVNSICKHYKFSTALSRQDIPPATAEVRSQVN